MGARRRRRSERPPSSPRRLCTKRTAPKIPKFAQTAIPEFGVGNVDKRGRRPCVQREGVPCEKTVADTEQPIAPPAWPSYGTHLPLRNLCILRTVCVVVSRFRGRHRALCAGRGILGRLFGLREAARPRTWQYVITHGISVTIRDKVHITNSWQSSRKKDRFWSARSSVMRLFTQTRPRWELLNKR